MGNDNLTKEQKDFLEECNLEFSERFTDSDIEYKKIFDSEIPPPPIVAPWYGRQRFNNRDRPGGSYNNYRDQNYRREGNQNYRREDNHNYRREDNQGYRREGNRSHGDRRYRPY
ncbi:unnamed protein product [Phyllotreta striolata]|uniref:Uncharacterized protein n=1 Tax=Phyllotreta striolata TaxID=444603 RepID=A0A9N9TH46_PHYSR|nr:unnamed protein product [Phyllotreta striolata]